jgi:hypothetical protein
VARWLRALVLIGGIAVVGVTGYGCSSSATPAPASQGAAQASQPGASAPASAAGSAANPSAAASVPSAPAGAAGLPSPAGQKRYKCPALISDAEMRSASGYPEAKLSGDDQSGELAGQTYCQFFTGSAGISISVSVFTAGSGWDKAFAPLWKLGQVTPGVVQLSGIGDGAMYSGTSDKAGIALVSGHGISVIFSDLLSGKLKGMDLQAQVAKILTLVAGRV